MAILATTSVTIFFIYLFVQTSCADNYNVISFGANPDGKIDSTLPFLKAWRLACSSPTESTIDVPNGRFLLTTTTFKGPCKSPITFRLNGSLVAPLDYRALRNSGYWILFTKVNRVSVIGGNIDANGAGYWACKKSGKNCPVGTRVC